MTSIGFIGLGSMGQAMAARLLEGGLDVGVWNRTAAAGDELVAAGATRLDSPAQAFERDIVISILANDQAVDAVFSEELLTGAGTGGSLHVNMASIGLGMARTIGARHAAAGVRYLGAPVMGRPDAARTGQQGPAVRSNRVRLGSLSEGFRRTIAQPSVPSVVPR